MARGNGRQAIFHSDDDYERMTDGLAKTVSRTDWLDLKGTQHLI
jgi:hypothetical protein